MYVADTTFPSTNEGGPDGLKTSELGTRKTELEASDIAWRYVAALVAGHPQGAHVQAEGRKGWRVTYADTGYFELVDVHKS